MSEGPVSKVNVAKPGRIVPSQDPSELHREAESHSVATPAAAALSDTSAKEEPMTSADDTSVEGGIWSRCRAWLVEHSELIAYCLLGGGFLILVWFLLRGFVWDKFLLLGGWMNLEKASYVGDFIAGSVGVIISLVNVFLLIETLRLQRKEQTQARKDHRDELQFQESQRAADRFARSQEAEASNYAARLNRFNELFFNMLSLYDNVVDNIECGEYRGKKAFKKLVAEMSAEARGKSRRVIREVYFKYYSEYPELGVYFRTLYRIFSYIEDDKSLLKEPDKVHYAKIARAMLTDDELVLIYYNARLPFGKKMRPIINKYYLLKHLPFSSKFEYGKYFDGMSVQECASVSTVIKNLAKGISRCENNGTPMHQTYVYGKYCFKCDTDERENLIFTVNITRREEKYYNMSEGAGLLKYDVHTLGSLCSDVISDLLIVSRFYVGNQKYRVGKLQITTTQERHDIILTVENRQPVRDFKYKAPTKGNQ